VLLSRGLFTEPCRSRESSNVRASLAYVLIINANSLTV
jgi:hypothetical protein